MMKINQFDIWLADLNPRSGTEAGKIRPVIVVQTNLLNGQHPSTIVCPITTNVLHEAEILRIHLKRSTFGLREDCDIMIDQLRAIDNKRLVEKLGEVDVEVINQLKDCIKVVLDLT